MQFKKFNEYIRQLQNFYGQNLSETELDIWYENLKGMSLERFNYVIAEIYRINKFMPKLSEILEVKALSTFGIHSTSFQKLCISNR